MDESLNILTSETSEMVPDEFLSWLMSDLEGKDAPNLSPSSFQSSIKTESSASQQPSNLNVFEGSSGSSSGGNTNSSNGGSILKEGVHASTQSAPSSSSSSSSSVNVKQNHECEEDGDDSEQEQRRDSKPGEKRKAPRSREIAKECRRRQRERKEELERRVATLKRENQELREHFQNVSQRTTDIQRQRANMESVMQNQLREIENLPEDSQERKNLVNLVMKFTDLYADYGSCRQKEIAFHLAQLEKLILPTQITKMILWTLQQDYKFFEEKSSPIWGILVKELDITPDQISFLTKQRSEALKLLLHLKESLSLINQLKVSIKDKHETFDRECGKITSEASANQSVRFILWITNNADKLAKVIPDFKRIVPHVSHAPDVAMP